MDLSLTIPGVVHTRNYDALDAPAGLSVGDDGLVSEGMDLVL